MNARRITRNGIAALVVIGVWAGLLQFGQAQTRIVEATPVRLPDALLVLGLIAERDMMLLQVPADADVVLPVQIDDWGLLLDQLTYVHGLEWCLAGWNIVVGPEGKVCHENVPARELVGAVVDSQHATAVEAAEAGSTPGAGVRQEEMEPRALRLRLRVVQIDERRATELGLNWRGGVFETAATLVGGSRLLVGGVFPPPVFDDLVQFLETEGVATRLEDVTLGTVEREEVVFNRGGTINVTLARETSIERSYQYGLGLRAVAEFMGEDRLLLRYTFDDSAPTVQSVELIELAATNSSGAVAVECGETVVLASTVSNRNEGEGGGLPGASRVPVLGYMAGAGSDRVTLGSFVVTMEASCAVV